MRMRSSLPVPVALDAGLPAARPAGEAAAGSAGRLGRGNAVVALLAMLLLAGIALVPEALRMIRSDLGSMTARSTVSKWLAGEPGADTGAWFAVRDDLLDAARISPGDPVLQDYLGSLHALRGVLLWDDEAERLRLYGQALQHQRASLALRPHNGLAWANAAASHAVLGERGGAFEQAWNAALAYGPNEADVQAVLYELAFSNWQAATPAMQAWVAERYLAGSPRLRARMAEAADRHGLGLVVEAEE